MEREHLAHAVQKNVSPPGIARLKVPVCKLCHKPVHGTGRGLSVNLAQLLLHLIICKRRGTTHLDDRADGAVRIFRQNPDKPIYRRLTARSGDAAQIDHVPPGLPGVVHRAYDIAVIARWPRPVAGDQKPVVQLLYEGVVGKHAQRYDMIGLRHLVSDTTRSHDCRFCARNGCDCGSQMVSHRTVAVLIRHRDDALAGACLGKRGLQAQIAKLLDHRRLPGCTACSQADE